MYVSKQDANRKSRQSTPAEASIRSSCKDAIRKSKKSRPGQPRLPNGPFLIKMLLRSQGNLSWPAEAPRWSVLSKDADRKSRKFRLGQPRLPDGPFLIKMLIGSQGNLGAASRGSQMVRFS